MNDKRRILYVEDDPVARDIVRRFVDGIYEIDFGQDGESALLKAKENSYDCFLMDIALRGKLNGIETTQKLKEVKDNERKPFIAITALVFNKDKEEILEGGLTHYLSKPFSRQDLLDLLERALNGNISGVNL